MIDLMFGKYIVCGGAGSSRCIASFIICGNQLVEQCASIPQEGKPNRKVHIG